MPTKSETPTCSVHPHAPQPWDVINSSIREMSDNFSTAHKDHSEQIKSIQTEAKLDRESASKDLRAMSKDLFTAISDGDAVLRSKLDGDNKEFRESQKAPWRVILSLLTLVFAVVLALYTSGVNTTSRIEGDSKIRSAENSLRLKEHTIHIEAVHNREMADMRTSRSREMDALHAARIRDHAVDQARIATLERDVKTAIENSIKDRVEAKTRISILEKLRTEDLNNANARREELIAVFSKGLDKLRDLIEDVDKWGSRKWIKRASE